MEYLEESRKGKVKGKDGNVSDCNNIYLLPHFPSNLVIAGLYTANAISPFVKNGSWRESCIRKGECFLVRLLLSSPLPPFLSPFLFPPRSSSLVPEPGNFPYARYKKRSDKGVLYRALPGSRQFRCEAGNRLCWFGEVGEECSKEVQALVCFHKVNFCSVGVSRYTASKFSNQRPYYCRQGRISSPSKREHRECGIL